MVRRSALLLSAFILGMASAVAAWAADTVWQPIDGLAAADQSLATEALAPMFGDNPQLWPDWLDPRAVLIPLARGQGDLLVVREPLHAPCGEYGFIVFGPPQADGSRSRLGDYFCAGALQVVPRQPLPDLVFSEGRVRDGDEGEWRRQDQRVRWSGSEWLLIRG